jgi:hypothetical protein
VRHAVAEFWLVLNKQHGQFRLSATSLRIADKCLLPYLAYTGSKFCTSKVFANNKAVGKGRCLVYALASPHAN